jgi:hypothetical protein
MIADSGVSVIRNYLTAGLIETLSAEKRQRASSFDGRNPYLQRPLLQ